MPRTDAPWDIILDGQGYLLARPDQLGRGGRAWSSQISGSSTSQRTAAETPYGNQPPTVESPMVYNDASLGYGDSKFTVPGRFNYSHNIDSRFPGQLFLSPLINEISLDGTRSPTVFFEQNNDLYCIAGRYCKRIDADGSVHLEKDLGSEATGACLWDGNVYVAMGLSVGIWKRSAAGVWTQSSDVYRNYFAPFKDKLWSSDTNYTVSVCIDDPMQQSSWTAGYPVGDATYDITSLAELNDVLYIGKENGLYALVESGRYVQLMPELASSISALNCKGMIAWHGVFWVPHLRGLLSFQPQGANGNIVSSETPGQETQGDNEIRGRITVLTGDNHWMYAALETVSGHSYIMVAREKTGGDVGPGQLVWHPWIYVGSHDISAMFIHASTTNPRLYFGISSQAGYVDLPQWGNNPLNDPYCEYETSGYLVFSSHDMGAPGTPKLYKSIEVEADNVHASRYLRISYRTPNSIWKYPLEVSGREAKVTTPLRTVLSLGTAGIEGTSIEVRVEFVGKSGKKSPVLKTLIVRGAERPRPLELITTQIRCFSAQAQRSNNSRERRSMGEMVSALEALASAGRAVWLQDVDGIEKQVVVLTPLEKSESNEEKGMSPEVICTVRMARFEAEEVSTVQEYGYYAAISASISECASGYATTYWGDGSVWKETPLMWWEADGDGNRCQWNSGYVWGS
jgi:hypothetical protein